MKKQILILAFFVLAMMAGSLTSFGQLGPSTTTVTPLNCAPGTFDALHPIAGVPYTYKLINPVGNEQAADYTWWATKDQNFISGPVGAAMANTNFSTKLATPSVVVPAIGTYGVTTPVATTGANEVVITWGADVLAGTNYQGNPGPGTPTFVVGYSKGTTCTNDNIQVYEINPSPNFTIAILPIDPASTATYLWQDNTGAAKECVDVVQGATYNPATFLLDMDYGTNTFYYEVGAANFVKDWTPRFQITDGLRSTQTAVIAMYSTLADAKAVAGVPLWTSASIAFAGMDADILTSTTLTATNPIDVALGVSVYVKVVITNVTEESLTNNDFVLAVDAQDNSEAGNWDMADTDCGASAPFAADVKDFATIRITPRPQLDAGTTSTTAPTLTIPKPSTSSAPF